MASVAVQSAGSAITPSAVRANIATLWLIAMTPVLFALSTWSHAEPTHTTMGFVRYFSLPVIAVELIVILFALASGVGVLQRALSIPGWMLASFAALAMIAIGTNAFVAIEKGIGTITAAFWFIHVGFAFSVAALAERRWHCDAETIWLTILIGLLCYLAIAVAFIATVGDPNGFDWVAFNLGAINIRHAAPYAVIGFMASIAIGASADTKRARLMSVCALLFMTFIFWSGTRAALFSVLGTLGLGLALFPVLRNGRTLKRIGIAIVGGALLSLLHMTPNPSLGIFNTVERSQAHDSADVSSGRKALWQGTLVEISRRPVFGHGDSQVSWFVPVAKDLLNHPHNSILQLLFQWGVTGAALFFAVIGALWLRMTRAARTVPTQHLHAWLVVTGIMGLSLLDGSLYFPYPVMMVAFSLAASEALHRRRKTDSGA